MAKSKETKQNILLGIFVLVGLMLFLIGVFFVGNNESLFQRSFLLHAKFSDAGGLQKGDNVWLTGVKVGTISKVDIIDDSTVYVSIRIGNKFKEFIKEDVVATLGRDGVMGNRILILKKGNSKNSVQEDQVIAARSGDETDELMSSLKQSGDNIQTITEKINGIAGDIEDGKGMIGQLLTNETWKNQFNRIMTQMEITSNNTAIISGDLSGIVKGLKQNKSGLIGTLVMDTTFSKVYSQSLAHIQITSENAARVTGDFKELMDQLQRKGNTVSLILTDTTFANNLKKTPQLLNEDLEAARHNFLLRGYFKKNKK